MDWTGGTRRRYAARKSVPLLQKQKAHFAKARASMRHAPVSGAASKPPLATVVESVARSAHTPTTPRPLYQHLGSRKVECASPYAHEQSQVTKNNSNGRVSGVVNSRTYPERAIPINSDVASYAVVEERPRSDRAWSVRKPNATGDEELLLLANRRRLLARSDWLRLGPTKPLRMKFLASRDRDQIGKRRKISKSGSQKAKPARQRLITPLFEERLKPAEYLMSGALPNDEVQEAFRVKIGTDAFASQSYHSQTPEKLSVRRQSNSIDLISEESMLLGADGDIFDANTVEIPLDTGHSHVNKSTGESVLAYHGSQTFGTGVESLNYRYDSVDDVEQQRNRRSHPRHVYESVAFQDHGSLAALDTNWYQRNRQEEVKFEFVPNTAPMGPFELGLDAEQLQRELAESVSERDSEHPQSEYADPELGSEWERFLGLPSRTLEHDSTAALNSHSQHITTSGSLQGPPQGGSSANGAHSGTPMSTPKGAGTQASFLRHHPLGTNDSGTIPDSGMQSPSASLRQTSNLAQQPATTHQPRPATARTEDPDDDALWRQFIIGSRSSDGSGDQDFGLAERSRAKLESTNKARSPVVDAPTAMSARVTKGTSLCVTGSTSSLSNVATAGRPRDGIQSNENTDNNSVAVETESIEEIPPSPVAKKSRANIHADTTTHLNPKRFKKSAKQAQSKVQPASKFTQGSLPQANKRRRTQWHSVYDLVDSDGASLVS